ncbi:MAG TPA: hypothetical protein PKD55_02415 [Bellilinea sp.]|nr:hypothetical protein [Bellilinea sp.]
MNKNDRMIVESPIYQGEDERIPYPIDTTPWGGSPSNPVITIKDSTGADVTAAHTLGVATVNGDKVITPLIINLTKGATYRLEVMFDTGGKTLEAFAILKGRE